MDRLALGQLARRRALERSYPIAKQLAEVLELEAIEPLATRAKHIRRAIGAELAELYYSDVVNGDVTSDRTETTCTPS